MVERGNTVDRRAFHIAGFGAAYGERTVSNGELERELLLDAGWIAQRCGVQQRHVADRGATSDLAAEAGARALLMAGGAVDLVICSTFTPDYLLCPTAPTVAHKLGLESAGAFDLNAACAGGVTSLITAVALLHSGAARRILLICADTTTRFLRSDDASTRALFSDAAVALVLEILGDPRCRLVGVSMGSDGSGAPSFRIPCGGSASRGRDFDSTVDQARASSVVMSGRDLFQFAVVRAAGVIDELCALAGVRYDGVSHIAVHQANQRITRALQRKVPIPPNRWLENVQHAGNTSSASVLLCLVEAMAQRRVHPGDRTLIVGFGAGLVWAGAALLWDERPHSASALAAN